MTLEKMGRGGNELGGRRRQIHFFQVLKVKKRTPGGHGLPEAGQKKGQTRVVVILQESWNGRGRWAAPEDVLS